MFYFEFVLLGCNPFFGLMNGKAPAFLKKNQCRREMARVKVWGRNL
jgi:hypothetical protein